MDRVTAAGGEIQNSFSNALSGNGQISTDAFDRSIKDIRSKAETAANEISQYTAELSNIQAPEQMTDLSAKTEEVRSHIISLIDDMKSLGDTNVVSNDLLDLMKQFHELNSLYHEAKRNAESIESKPDLTDADTSALAQYKATMDSVGQQLTSLRHQQDALEQSGGAFIGEQSQQFQQLKPTINAVTAAYNELAEKIREAQSQKPVTPPAQQPPEPPPPSPPPQTPPPPKPPKEAFELLPDDNTDTTLTFDTALDTEGFDKGSEKLKQAIASVTNISEQAGRDVTDSFSKVFEDIGANVTPATFTKYITELRTRVTSLLTDMSKYESMMSLAKTQTQIDSVANKFKETRSQLELIIKEMEQLGQTNIQDERFSSFTKDIEEARAKLASLKQERDAQLQNLSASSPRRVDVNEKYNSQIAAAENELKNLETMVNSVVSNMPAADTDEFVQLSASIRLARDAYNDLAQAGSSALQRISAEEQAKAQAKAAKEATQQQKQAMQLQLAEERVQTQAAKTAQVQQQTVNQQTIAEAKAAATEQTAAAKAAAAEQVAAAKAAATEQTAAARAAATERTAIARAEATQQTAAARTAAIEQQTINQQRVADARAAATETTAAARAAATEQTAAARAAATEQESAARAAATQQTAAARAAATQQTAAAQTQLAQARTRATQVQTTFRVLAGVSKTLEGAISRLGKAFGTVGRAIGSLGSGVMRGASAAMNMLSASASRAAAAVRGLVSAAGNKLGSVFQSFHKQGKASIPIADTVVKKLLSLKNILISRIKRTLISDWFNQMKNGIGELQNHSSVFNAQMQSMQSSLRMMTANGTVSFGNFISAIQPMLTTILNAISQAIVYLNAFFALLSGKSTMTVAKKQTADYGKAAGGAAKKVEELKQQVYGFDELNKRDKDNDSDNSGGGGGGAGDLYEDVAVDSVVPDALMDYFTKIKEAIGAEQWEEVGGLIADGMNFVVQKIDEAILGIWDEAVKWTENIARVLNGFVERFDFEYLGKTISDGINLAFTIADTFITTFKWYEFGKGIGDLGAGLVKNVNFPLIGQTLGHGVNGALMFMDGAITNFPFSTLGQKLAAGVNSYIDTVNFAYGGAVLAKGVNGFKDTFREFAEGMHWKTWGDKIGAGVTAFFNGVEWTEAGETVQLWVDGIMETIGSLADNDEMWNSISNGISGFLDGLFDEKSIANVLTTVGKFVGQVFLTLGRITRDAPWETLGRGVAKGLNGVFDEQKATELGKVWSDAVQSVIDGVYEFVVNFKWDEAADAVSSFVRNLFDIDWSKLAFTVILGLGSLSYSISKALADITSDFPAYAQELANGVNKVFGTDENGESYIKWSEIGKNFGDSFRNIIEGMATFLEDVNWTQVGTDIADMLVHIPWGEIAASMWKLFKSTIKAVFNLVDAIGDALSGGSKKEINVGWTLGNTDENRAAIEAMTEDLKGDLRAEGMAAGTSFYEGFQEKFQEGTMDSKEQALQAAILIGEGYYTKLNELSPEAALAGTQLLGSIYSAATVDDLVKSFGDAGIQITEEFAQVLGTTGHENVQAALSLLGQGVSEGTISALNMNQLDADLHAYMEQTGMGLKEVALMLTEDSNAAVAAIADASKGEIYNSLDETMKGIVDNLVNGSLAQKDQIAQAAYWMFSGLGEAIEDVSPELAASANELLNGLYNAQTVEDVQAQFNAAGLHVTGAFAEALQGQGKENIAAALFLLGQGIDSETIQALDLSNIDQNLKSYMDASGKTITEVAGELAQDAGAAIGRIIPESAKKSLDDAKGEVKESSGDVADAADIGDQKDRLAKSSGEVGAAVPKATGEEMGKNVKDVDKPVKDLIERVEKPMEKLTPDQRKQAEQMMAAIDQMISEKNPVVETTMKTAAEAVLNKAGEYLNEDNGKKLAEKFVTGIMTMIIRKQRDVVRTAETMVNAVRTAVTAVLNETNGQTIAEAYSNGIHTGINSLSDIPEIIKGFTDAIEERVETSKGIILEKVANLVSGIREGISNGGIPDAFARVAGQAVSAVSSVINFSAGQKIGSQMAAGLKAGMNSGSAEVEEQSEKTALEAVLAGKRALGIASPSKVFYEIGQYAMEGLANGIERSGDEAVSLVGKTARSMANAAEGTDIEFGISATASSLDAVAEKLGNVAGIFREIATVFNTLGESAIPSVANGTFIPYRTRVDDGVGEETQAMAATMARATADQTEVIEDQRDILRELLTAVRGLRLSLDVDSVTNAVTSRQRMLERSTGTVVI